LEFLYSAGNKIGITTDEFSPANIIKIVYLLCICLIEKN
jgi:hypothetical protein